VSISSDDDERLTSVREARTGFARLRWPRRTLARSLYTRYVIVIVCLLALVGGIQFQSLQSALMVAGENSLLFALRDAGGNASTLRAWNPESFRRAAPRLLHTLSARGVNARLYDANLHSLGTRRSSYDPANLPDVTHAMIASMRSNSTLAFARPDMRAYWTLRSGQILLLGEIGPPSHPSGYVELGYAQSILFPIVRHQAIQFFLLSILVVLFAAALLIPVVDAPLRPLRRLLQAALRIRAGAFQERLPVIGTTETVRLAEVINDALDELADSVGKERRVSEAMKQFVSAASHELRTPLTAIRGFTDVLLSRVGSYLEEVDMLTASPADASFADVDGGEAPEYEDDFSGLYPGLLLDREKLLMLRQALTTVQQETGRLEHLVRDLLQLARLDEGMQPRMEQVDLADCVRAVIPQIDMLAHGREVTYDLHEAPTTCDPSMFDQIVYNLVGNAIQHTSLESGQIRISVGPTPSGRARFVVADNGSGIPAAQLDRIFDRFWRASDARERNPGGAGLGLSIVSDIVKLHGGSIRAQSQVGQGTEMIIEI
jgi:two-component system OmpR family sensor kinase